MASVPVGPPRVIRLGVYQHNVTMARYTAIMASGRITRPATATFAEAFTRVLDATMHERRASAIAVAEATGVARQTIGRIRRGAAAPDLHTAVTLADWCGYDLALVERRD